MSVLFLIQMLIYNEKVKSKGHYYILKERIRNYHFFEMKNIFIGLEIFQVIF